MEEVAGSGLGRALSGCVGQRRCGYLPLPELGLQNALDTRPPVHMETLV